jgi:hypothetical protein
LTTWVKLNFWMTIFHHIYLLKRRLYRPI